MGQWLMISMLVGGWVVQLLGQGGQGGVEVWPESCKRVVKITIFVISITQLFDPTFWSNFLINILLGLGQGKTSNNNLLAFDKGKGGETQKANKGEWQQHSEPFEEMGKIFDTKNFHFIFIQTFTTFFRRVTAPFTGRDAWVHLKMA